MEVEAKFAVGDAEALERLALARRLAGYGLGPCDARDDRDVFLDTADRRFLHAGYYCRRRETGDGVRLTLKGLGTAVDGVLRREELEAQVAADVPVEEWPRGPLRERVESIARGAPLAPLVELRQRRRTRAVFDGVRDVGELSLDEVEVGGAAGGRGWLEVEFELRADGGEDDLVKVCGALRRRRGLKPEGRAKFVRALETLDGAAALAEGGDRLATGATGATGVAPAAAPPAAGEGAGEPAPSPAALKPDGTQVRRKRAPIERDDTMAIAAVRVLRLHFNKMLAHEEGTRLGDDPEELHDMRVATRRMRMALRIFAPYLDEREVHPALKGLRRTGRRLGVVRDLDVFKGKAVKYAERLPQRRRKELDGLFAAWDEEYAARRAELVVYLDGGRYRRFVERMAALLEEPQERLSASAGQGTVAQVLPMLLHRDVADVLGAGALVGPGEPLARFHELRIASKALRYTLEFFETPLGRGARPLIVTMKGLQDHLGDLQDAVVASGLVRDHLTLGRWRTAEDAAPAPRDVVVDAGAARYLAARQQEMEDLIAGFPAVWPTVAGEEFGGRLARALARL